MRVVGWKMISVLPSLSNVVTALAVGRLLKLASYDLNMTNPNAPSSLSNIVTVLANWGQLRVASYGSVRGLQQTPPLTPGKGKARGMQEECKGKNHYTIRTNNTIK